MRWRRGNGLVLSLLLSSVLAMGTMGSEVGDCCGGSCGAQSPCGCWCDADCILFGDCCPDYCGQCPPGCGQCRGACGEQSSAGCWCDAACFAFQDCCPDVCFDCTGLPGCSFEGECAWPWQTAVGQPGISGPGNSIHALIVHEDGSSTNPALYAGGSISAAGGISVSKVARWDGQAWSSLGNGLTGGGPVRAFAEFDDGSGHALYVGGSFTTADGMTVNRIARWDGMNWSDVGGGMSNTVFALTVFTDGTGQALYAAGGFATAGGVTVNGVARWDGKAWKPLGGGMSGGFVHALAAFDDGTGDGPALYAAGTFTTADSAAASRIAKWDGQGWSPLGTGVNASFSPNGVFALAAFDDGTGPALYAAGDFTMAGGAPAHRIAKWDGKQWSPLGSGLSGPVYALKVYDDGSGPALYAGGRFAYAGGKLVHRIARWDGTEWSPLGDRLNATVRALTVFDDNAAISGGGPALFVGGDFSMAGNQTANRIAKWTGPLLGDLDCDGAVNVTDLLQLLSAWGACDDCPEDLNSDGQVGVQDLLVLLGAWG